MKERILFQRENNYISHYEILSSYPVTLNASKGCTERKHTECLLFKHIFRFQGAGNKGS
jgi:hypothetical protein